MRFLFFVLFCFASLLLFLGVFLPVIYRRGVRYSRCPSLWLFTSFLIWFDCYTPFPPPSFYSVVLVLALSSYLGCLAPFIYVYGCLSCPTHIICDCPGLFCFCPLFPSWIPPWQRCPLQATATPASFCLLSFLFFSFPTVFAPNLFWWNFLYLVTTTGFVADQLIMWDKNNVCDFVCFVLICLLPAI